MKKTAGKIGLFVICIVVIVFLLLPFLETSTPQTAQTADAKTATPQIFTSNPLTELVNRIARFFGNKNKTTRDPQPQTLTAAQTQERFGVAQNEDPYVAQNNFRAAGESMSTEATPTAGTSAMTEAGEEFYDGESWVLVRQTTPQGVTTGMHEVNSGNAYESYVQQERAARFTPTARVNDPTHVPDSKLARLFRPIQHFFGFDEAKQVSSRGENRYADDNPAGATFVASAGLGRSRNGTGSNFRRGANLDLGISGQSSFDASKIARETDGPSLLSYLNPEAMFEEIGEAIAESRHADAKTRAAQEAKENDRRRLTAEQEAAFKARAQERMFRLSNGEQATDEMGTAILNQGACSDSIVRSVSPKETCDVALDGTKPTNTTPVQQLVEQNRILFAEKTGGIPMPSNPPATITVVLGKVTSIPQEEEDPELQDLQSEDASVEFQEVKKFYQFMADSPECQGGDCYWVANAKQVNPDLQNAVEGAGVKFKGDPLGKYAQISRQYFQQELKNTPAEEREQRAKELKEILEQYAPAYVTYTADELKTIQQQNKEAVKNRDMAAGSALYAVSAPVGEDLSKSINSYNFFYGKGGNESSFTGEQYSTVEERSKVLTESLADQVSFIRDFFIEMKQEAAKQVVQNKAAPILQGIQKQAEQDIKDFHKNNNPGANPRGR